MSLEDINTETWSCRLGVGCKTDDLALKKRINVKRGKDIPVTGHGGP
jgi:hypothetical protein